MRFLRFELLAKQLEVMEFMGILDNFKEFCKDDIAKLLSLIDEHRPLYKVRCME